MNNYTLYHLHSDYSNGVTNIDSVTKYNEYIDEAKKCGMKALAFSEHGSIFGWYMKKCDIEKAGMKYIHAIEAYITSTLEEKIRDNYHCVLIAKNYDGFLELNRLISQSFNRNDNHFYYVPRISFDELFSTSDNIIITTACIGGVIGKTSDGDADRTRFIEFLQNNKHRCYLEIGHHQSDRQIAYNKAVNDIANEYGIPLIAGTDTHVLNEDHESGRHILQVSKNIIFEDEDGWDLKFKTYDQLVESFRMQGCLPRDVYMQAIENTNAMADMVESYEIDCNTKYPHIYENPEETFYQKIKSAEKSHPYLLKNHSQEKIDEIVDSEFEVYKKTQSIDFMLLQTYLREWEQEHNIRCGYGRGSVTGSMIAYILGITQMDSERFNLNFFRFMNPARVTNADIDTDYGKNDRAKVKEFILRDKLNLPQINTAEIITFNTIDTKGAIRDVCRAIYKREDSNDYLKISDEAVKLWESDPEVAEKKYVTVFKHVNNITGTIVSIGTHPSGILISDLPINETIGLCSIKTTDYPVSMINMKELDSQMYVKLDILGLDNIAIINETCDMVGIPRMTPDSVDLNDENVWRDIREDTTCIFQWESQLGQKYLKKFLSDKTLEIAKHKMPDFNMLQWFSFGNGLIRPTGASFRDAVASGEFYDNGFKELNEFLAPEAGRIVMQETIMKFLVEFCGYSDAESDSVRRAIAKKKGTEQLIPEIERRFIDYSSSHYDITKERCEEVVKPFIKIILDASEYGFSWNHSIAYSCIGYISGYLRYYYPLQFLTASLNIFDDDTDKTMAITRYANKLGIKVMPPRWGISRSNYFYNEEDKTIAKGLKSVKFMNDSVAEELHNMYKNNKYDYFVDLLKDIEQSSINSRQLDILIKIDFFENFGNQRELLRIKDMFYEFFKKGQAKKILKTKVDGTIFEDIVKKYSTGETMSGGEAKSYTLLDIDSIMLECEKMILDVHLSDLSDVLKVKNFIDVMGYSGYVSGKQQDRPKLYVSKIRQLKRKKDGVRFGYSIDTKSIGSGKESSFTILNSTYNSCPIDEGDIIYCSGFVREGQYYKMTSYYKIM